MEKLSLAINRWISHIGSAALALLMLLTVADVVGRYLFNRPVSGTFELTEMSMVLIVFLALGLAQHHNEHIALDLAYNFFSLRLKKITDLIVDCVHLAVVLAIMWQLYAYAMIMIDGNYTTAVLQLPLYPFVFMAVAGIAAYVLAILSDFGKSLRKSARK